MVSIGYFERDRIMDLATALAFGSSPKSKRILINSSSEAELIKSAAVGKDPSLSKRMSKGSFRWKLNPAPLDSSCQEERPRSIKIPFARAYLDF